MNRIIPVAGTVICVLAVFFSMALAPGPTNGLPDVPKNHISNIHDKHVVVWQLTTSWGFAVYRWNGTEWQHQFGNCSGLPSLSEDAYEHLTQYYPGWPLNITLNPGRLEVDGLIFIWNGTAWG